MGMIQFLVDKCHVGDSNRHVIKFVISRMKHGRETWLKLDRTQRRDVMREAIRAHSENRGLYRNVMSGRF